MSRTFRRDRDSYRSPVGKNVPRRLKGKPHKKGKFVKPIESENEDEHLEELTEAYIAEETESEEE